MSLISLQWLTTGSSAWKLTAISSSAFRKNTSKDWHDIGHGGINGSHTGGWVGAGATETITLIKWIRENLTEKIFKKLCSIMLKAVVDTRNDLTSRNAITSAIFSSDPMRPATAWTDPTHSSQVGSPVRVWITINIYDNLI